MHEIFFMYWQWKMECSINNKYIVPHYMFFLTQVQNVFGLSLFWFNDSKIRAAWTKVCVSHVIKFPKLIWDNPKSILIFNGRTSDNLDKKLHDQCHKLTCIKNSADPEKFILHFTSELFIFSIKKKTYFQCGLDYWTSKCNWQALIDLCRQVLSQLFCSDDTAQSTNPSGSFWTTKSKRKIFTWTGP